jgi:hypothetical protein
VNFLKPFLKLTRKEKTIYKNKKTKPWKNKILQKLNSF